MFCTWPTDNDMAGAAVPFPFRLNQLQAMVPATVDVNRQLNVYSVGCVRFGIAGNTIVVRWTVGVTIVQRIPDKPVENREGDRCSRRKIP